MAIFFPNWVVRESAISRSPLRFENSIFRLCNWVENEEKVTAAISSFGELWDINPISDRRDDVSFHQARIRCPNVHQIPELLNLMVDDRRFRIPIEIESWEEARPILLDENIDRSLGLDTTEEQENFLRQIGFSSIPSFFPRGAAGVQPREEETRRVRRKWRPREEETRRVRRERRPREEETRRVRRERRPREEETRRVRRERRPREDETRRVRRKLRPRKKETRRRGGGDSGVGEPLDPRCNPLVAPPTSGFPLASFFFDAPSSSSGPSFHEPSLLGPIPSVGNSTILPAVDAEPSLLGPIPNVGNSLLHPAVEPEPEPTPSEPEPEPTSSEPKPELELELTHSEPELEPTPSEPELEPTPSALEPKLKPTPSEPELEPTPSALEPDPNSQPQAPKALLLRQHSLCPSPAAPLPQLEKAEPTPPPTSVRPGPRLTLLLRRSPCLAAKYRGNNKPSLHRAQELMCKKLKLAIFASKAPYPLSCPLPSPSTATPLHQTSPPPPADETCPAALLPTSRIIEATRDTANPLTRQEILQIKASCGIVDIGIEASHVPQAPPTSDAV
uniref:Uncharacterized protein n=1 Tax=Ananas comosus var. bracteatus TaxID=296719 RepID=A0A6V7Q3K3_ANACO|nr:unnamed protein product [Ananas comosus var. bracteatus]